MPFKRYNYILVRMEYNTNRSDMRFREYGRSVGKIIENVCELPEGETKNEATQGIITVMALVSGMSLRDDVSYHKLWDHLMVMSDFKLRGAWPFGDEELEKLMSRENEAEKEKKERLPYKDSTIASRHYGEYIEAMLHNLKSMPDGDEYNDLVTLIAQQAKRDYLVWNGELSDDNIIVDHMLRVSGDERIDALLRDKPITVPNGSLPVETTGQKKKKKKKKNY